MGVSVRIKSVGVDVFGVLLGFIVFAVGVLYG